MNLVLGIFLLFIAEAHAGGLVGNGGHSIFCERRPGSPLAGFYNKDYLYSSAKNPGNSEVDLFPVASWDASAERIGSVITRHLPELSASFTNFRHFVFRKPDGNEIEGEIRWWVSVEEEFPQPIKLEDYGVPGPYFPENCLTTKTEKHVIDGVEFIVVVSAVVPHKTVDRTVLIDQKDTRLVLYRYSPRLVDQLNPMNLSFLMVHEWLWDFTNDAAVNERVNRFIHSREFTRLNRKQLLVRLRQLGLAL